VVWPFEKQKYIILSKKRTCKNYDGCPSWGRCPQSYPKEPGMKALEVGRSQFFELTWILGKKLGGKKKAPMSCPSGPI
jgi:hypothetical protein